MVLITGANGLVGSYLARYLLLKGEKVRAIKRSASDMSLIEDIKDDIEWIEGDVLDLFSLDEAINGVEKIYHSAALISYVSADREKLMKVNAEGTANVVNIALQQNVKKLLHVSSIAAIGRNNSLHITEDNEWEKTKNISDYAISKFLGEREVWRGIAEGLNAVIINPSLIAGAGNFSTGSSKLFSTVYSGFKFYTEGVTGYVDVRDVAKISYLLMESGISSERFIVNAENIMYRDYFFMIADALNVKRPSLKANKFLSELAWRGDWLRHKFTGKIPAVTKATAQIANKEFYFDNSKIKGALNYEFIHIRKTIRDTAKIFLEYQKIGKMNSLSFDGL